MALGYLAPSGCSRAAQRLINDYPSRVDIDDVPKSSECSQFGMNEPVQTEQDDLVPLRKRLSNVHCNSAGSLWGWILSGKEDPRNWCVRFVHFNALFPRPSKLNQRRHLFSINRISN
ncbi:hypothetical protein N7510_005969 [Penicillium lagena]|uniref:uncharacterized protein n=1 Tax=Penicillium lagena TaxID=94218 RepID=UPI0025423C1F|nr:uncharacterized protein N7510_005969 [Penicillium lagena]KAJ5612775.1 hypothetical protein N7510_005969 [Penicillium lagena]